MHALPRFEPAAITNLYPLNLNAIERDGGADLTGVCSFDFGDLTLAASLTFYAYIILLDDALDKSFQDELFRWIGEKKLGFFYDCLNPNPSNGGLLHKDWSTVRAMKLVLLNGIVGTPLSRCASSVCAQRSRAVRCR